MFPEILAMSSDVKIVPKTGRKRATKAVSPKTAGAMATGGTGAAKPAGQSAKATARRTVSAEERRRMIAEAAYFIAEREKFHADPAWCWLEAEKEIDRKVAVQ